MEPFKQHFVQDLTQTIKDRHCGSIVFNADNESNVVSVSLFNGSEPVAISGSVVGAVVCPDGATVPLTGSYSGNTASVTLTGDCFAVIGQIGVGIQIVNGTQKITVLKAFYYVETLTTENVVDPGSRITLGVGDLVDDIEAAVASIPADYSDLLAAIAPNYSELTFPVKAGAFCWYNGALYQAQQGIATSEAWTAAHWASAVLTTSLDEKLADVDDEIGDLKRITENLESAVFTTRQETLTNISVNGYYSNGELVSSASALGRKADVTGLASVTIHGMIPRWYDYYAFINANDEIISFLRNTTADETISMTVDVPEGAVYVGTSSNTSQNANTLYFTASIDIDNIEQNANAITALDTRVAALEQGGAVSLVKNGNAVQIRSAFNGENDIAIRGTINGSSQGSFCYTNMYIMPANTDADDTTTGSVFKTMSDDICPLYFNRSYRGAGHGDERGKKVTCASAHGLTEANIGEVWQDADNHNWMIIKIISTTEFVVAMPPSQSDYNKLGFASATMVSPLTHNDNSVAFTSVDNYMVNPASNHVSVKVYADGKEITSDGTYKAKYIDIVESYDIIYIPALCAYLADNVGNNTNTSYYSDDITEKYCTVNNVYHFTERGAITGYQTVDFARDVLLKLVGFIQSEPIGNYVAVPHATGYKTLYNMGAAPSTAVYLSSDIWSDADNPPNRMFQFSSAGGNGIALGYGTEFADGRPSIRKTKLSGSNGAGFYFTYHKIYPFVVSTDGEQTGSAVSYSAFTYIVPLCAYDADFNAVGWYYVNDDIYLVVDAQQSVSKYLALPQYMMGRKAEIVDYDGSFAIPSPIVSASGLMINVDTYGSAVIKLSK